MAKAAATCPTDWKATSVRAIDALLLKIRACPNDPDIDRTVRHLIAARGGPPPPVSEKARLVRDLRAEIARLNERWPNGPKVRAERANLALVLLGIVRALIEKGYGAPAKPLTAALQREAGLSQDEADTVIRSMLRSGCLLFPLGLGGAALDEDACAISTAPAVKAPAVKAPAASRRSRA